MAPTAPNPAARALARGLEKAAYRGAKHVVALSPGMRDGVVAAGVDPARVTLIPNAADLDLLLIEKDSTEWGGSAGRGFGEFSVDGVAEAAGISCGDRRWLRRWRLGFRLKRRRTSGGSGEPLLALRLVFGGDNLLGTCGGATHGRGTRTALADWNTRISQLTP